MQDAQLNPAQRAAVRETDTPMLVIAGAGSGKTRVITLKIAHLVGALGTAPERVRAVTFTNKAAREMSERVRALLPAPAALAIRIGTFHRLGLEIVAAHHRELGFRPGFSIVGEADSRAIVDALTLRHAGAGVPDTGTVRYALHAWKNDLRTPDDLADGSDPLAAEHPALRQLFADYRDELRARNVVDFDDLIYLPTLLLEGSADLRAEYQERLSHLLVDEYQDTNRAQYRLMKSLVGPRTGLTVVGDDDQSIYSWRGARPENLSDLKEDFARLRVIKLERNYRSFRCILEAANALIDANEHLFPKTLTANRGAGTRPRVVRTADAEDEAERVAELLAHHRFVNGRKFGDYAILYRSNHQARVFELALRERRVPYRLVGGSSFFDLPEIKDVLAYCRLVANPDDNQAFYRAAGVPRRGIGVQTLRALEAVAAETRTGLLDAIPVAQDKQDLSARALRNLEDFRTTVVHFRTAEFLADPRRLVRTLLDDIGYRDWLEASSDTPEAATRRGANVDELIGWMEVLSRQGADLGDVLNQLMIFDIAERRSAEDVGDNVTLSTLHAAKGLEFEHVFMVGVEEGLLPHRHNRDGAGLEEERRLAYVGITRARETLTLTYAARRKAQGRWLDTEPSRFLKEIPRDLLDWGDGGVDPEAAQQNAADTLRSLRELLG